MPRETEPAEAVPLMGADDDQIGLRFGRQPDELRIHAPPAALDNDAQMFLAQQPGDFFPHVLLQHALHPGRVFEQPERPGNAQPGRFLRRPISIRRDHLARADLPQLADPAERGVGIGSEISPDKNVQWPLPARPCLEGRGVAYHQRRHRRGLGGALRHTAEQRARGRTQSERGDHEQARLPLPRELHEHLVRRSGGNGFLDGRAPPPQTLGLLVQALTKGSDYCVVSFRG